LFINLNIIQILFLSKLTQSINQYLYHTQLLSNYIPLTNKYIVLIVISKECFLEYHANITNEIDACLFDFKGSSKCIKGGDFAKENIVINDSEIDRMKARLQ